ncbi:UNVERIFIED_CONTAM: hypothetical protein Sradi_4124300 [Sesamum radiatum]|uniref:Uncharacterized protein n=1 Tax=Sesamum radiatum TaxID=300843 RepID=A0AAW2P4T1_SESRA
MAGRWKRKKGKKNAVATTTSTAGAPPTPVGKGKGKGKEGSLQWSRANDVYEHCQGNGHWKRECPQLLSNLGMFVIEVNMKLILLLGYWIPAMELTSAITCRC